MRLRLLPAIVAIAFAVPAEADDGAPVALDEPAFVAALAAEDPRLARLDGAVGAARAEVLAARARPEPSLAFDREEIFPDGGSATNQVRITLPIDVSGRRGNRIDAAHARVAASEADREAGRVAIVVDGLRAYAAAAHARLYHDVLVRDREALVRAVEVTRKRAAAGAAAGYDAQRIELELAAYDDLIASAALERSDTARALGALIGRPAVEATSSLALPAAPAAVEPAAIAARPDHRAATLRMDAARAQARAASRGWVPGLSLSGGFMTADVGGETAFGYTAGLAITIPIFDRGQAERARADAERAVAAADARWIERTVPAQVARARERLVARRAQAEQLIATRLGRLDELLRAAETAYREGDASIVELLDAYRTAREIHLRDLELRRDARLAELDLQLATGVLP